MDTAITRAEHEEFRNWVETEKKRLEDEDERQNNRLKLLEEDVRQISVLKVTGYIITAVIGIMIGFIFKQIGM